jgi:SAM-dependent methyltransferase
MAGNKPLKGWFVANGRVADRTLKQQLIGLDTLVERAAGKTVFDVGCAEGLISIHLCRHGARAAHGIEIRPDYVEIGNKMAGKKPCTFEVADANDFKPKRQYDIVLLLAVLHKLKNPAEACKRFAAAARELVVLRLPPKHAPLIIDSRSDDKPFDMAACMKKAGFTCTSAGFTGPFDEWMGYFERRA